MTRAKDSKTVNCEQKAQTSKDASIRKALLAWYKKHARDLPWRKTKDPYAIWVSEIMLQQTRVDTVIPYYQKFLKSFPTPESLANADEDEILSHWSGLGYYRRARLLHKGVKETVEKYDAQVPKDPAKRLSIPGIGKYTAGAIGSIAYEQEEPLVDGNVARVLSRLYKIETPLGSKENEKALWQKAETLIQGKKPGDFNQALMELGATVCTPKKPQCQTCPVQMDCQALKENKVESLPVPRPRKKPQKMRLIAITAYKNESRKQLWMMKGQHNLFGGLWNLPLEAAEPKELSSKKALEKKATKILEAASASPQKPLEWIGKTEHILTHRHFYIDVYLSKQTTARQSKERRWIDPNQLTNIGVSKLVKKVLSLS